MATRREPDISLIAQIRAVLDRYYCRHMDCSDTKSLSHRNGLLSDLADVCESVCQPREVDREKLERVLSRHFEQTQTGTTWNQAKDDLMAWATGERVRACAHEGEIEVNVQHRDEQGNVVPYRQRVLVDLLTMTGTCPICGAKRP